MHFGGQEIWIVLGIVVLLFGAKKIPELGKSLGQGLKEFKKSTKAVIEDEDEDDAKAKEAEKDTAA
ncbi:MAG TPA: twin-arginine translocase TatA/TatE family subunit [Armatimonadota bacterium]|nr:twin-arginine translocase TatA/TatE family subunit [Armatimonadota bacterium]